MGFTEDQKKFWDHDGAKNFKGMCLDQSKPDFLVLDYDNRYTAGRINSVHPAIGHGESDGGLLDSGHFEGTLRDDREGTRLRDVPSGLAVENRPGQAASASDMAPTIADPAVALENALKWLKKENKL